MLLLHFLRLIRFGNLLVIGVTMCIVQAFIAVHGNSDYGFETSIANELEELTFTETYFLQFNLDWNFLLLILSVMLIAGAGNIINDYFDIKADRVNKPEKMVVEKHIKRRWAIMWNWIFNVIGLGISAYLSWLSNNWVIFVIALLTINFLWFYSALYKRKIFVGNIIVALLVGVVPIYVLIYNLPLNGFEVNYQDSTINLGSFFTIKIIIIVAIIAFVINLMREIIKDMADIRGDMYLAAKTVPIALGIRKTKTILSLLLIPLLCLIIFYIYDIRTLSDRINQFNGNEVTAFSNLYWFNFFVITSGLICIVSFALLLSSERRKHYLLSSNLLKLAMLFGMVSPLFL